MAEIDTALDLGPPPPIFVPPIGPVAGAPPPSPAASSGASPPAAAAPAAAPPPPPAPSPAPSPPAAPAPPAASSAPATYTVKSGDSLSAIATRNGTTVGKILEANPQIKNPDSLSVGQQIKIPGKGGGGSAGSTSTPQPQKPPEAKPADKPPSEPTATQPAGSLVFPLWIKPSASWKDGPRYFGCPRSGGKRKHGGVDLYAPFGAKIRAIADGEIIRGPYPFYDGTNALEVYHPGVGVVRYGEISSSKRVAVKAGQKVKVGELIAYVGLLDSLQMSMIHFELFGEKAKGQSLSGGGPFRRNAALKDPTPLVDKLYKLTFG
jgi:biotin carboxyl carrier protein